MFSSCEGFRTLNGPYDLHHSVTGQDVGCRVQATTTKTQSAKALTKKPRNPNSNAQTLRGVVTKFPALNAGVLGVHKKSVGGPEATLQGSGFRVRIERLYTQKPPEPFGIVLVLRNQMSFRASEPETLACNYEASRPLVRFMPKKPATRVLTARLEVAIPILGGFQPMGGAGRRCCELSEPRQN